MAEQIFFDPDLEWLDHVRPVGLVIASNLVKELGLIPERQTQTDTAEVAEIVQKEGAALPDPWTFMSRILGWDARYVAGAPGGPALPDVLSIRLPEHETTLSPTWAVRELSSTGSPWQLLVQIEGDAIDPDERGALDGWEATAHQRFERLLRETGVFAGVLISAKELRLVYAPRGETSGWLSFPLRDLAGVSGRPMLAGLKLILGSYRLFNDADDRRLPALLKRSRDAQAAVSTKLAEQVLGALHELLRGLDRAEPDLVRDIAKHRPGELYEGLLTVLMRLVFILYAEDRDLIPSRTDAQARALYDENYSVRGLFSKLVEDAALNPDTMDERLGGWGRLIALFRLVHKGDAFGWIKGRGGKLFDPDAFPFLEGRKTIQDAPRVIKVPDGFVLRILEGLMTIENKRGQVQQKRARERLSYRTLDVEQIGSVYETVMGFTVETASGSTLAIKAGKKNNVPVFINLDALVGQNGAARLKRLKETTGRDKFGGRVETAIKAAKSAPELAVAFASVVDNRGSPNEAPISAGTPILQPTDERRRTGSHYTPRSLTEPIVRHALAPAFERLGPDAKPEDILDLKVCDPAMGSGAFLVEACRAIADRLTDAWKRCPKTRPKIPADEDEELHARRLVAQRCLYGVDKNPMAADLAKLSLWLATLARDHEFEFVDHALKSGDSLVGLTDKQLEAAHWDETAPSLGLYRELLRSRVKQSIKLRDEIRNAPDDELRFMQECRHSDLEKLLQEPRTIGDAIISAFFAEAKPKAREIERTKIESNIVGGPEAKPEIIRNAAARLHHGEHPIRPFHWQLEFPEVFQRKNPGFDAIVGNPPFLGGTRIAAEHGKVYMDFLKAQYEGAGDRADLVAYFFRRAFNNLRMEGTFGLIASNTIAQGDTRNAALRLILSKGGRISRAISREKWPGEAAVVVSVVHVRKGELGSKPLLGSKYVKRISAYLVEGDFDADPYRLAANAAQAFEGMVPYGDGFKVTAEEHKALGDKARDCIFPFIGGKHLNNDPAVQPEALIAYFRDLPLSTANERWPDVVKLLEERVKPDRASRSAEVAAAPWWLFWRARLPLWRRLESTRCGFARTRVSAHHALAKLPFPVVPDTSLVVFPALNDHSFAALQSRIHEVWARFFASSMKDDMRYTPSDCFATFPFPPNFETSPELEATGQAYHDHRAALMIARNEGLTKTYNHFHKHTETSADIVALRELHAAMDDAVLRAYGWNDLADKAKPEYLDETNEDDHKYQGRFFWPAAFRDEVLALLLELNAKRAEEERLVGLTPAVAEEDETDANEGDDE